MSYKPFIKICGIKNKEILQLSTKAGADMVGFVYFEKSPRHIELDQIKYLISLAKIKTTILTVNPNDDLLKKIARIKPDYLQLHGNENINRIKEIKQKYGLKIIKALPIANEEDIKNISEFYEITDLIILDAKPPKDATRTGGLGKVFDWDLLKLLDPKIKYMLSGGLDVKNVKEAVLNVKPFGLDVSSGVEKTLGEKDEEKIINFIKNARLNS